MEERFCKKSSEYLEQDWTERKGEWFDSYLSTQLQAPIWRPKLGAKKVDKTP